MTLVSALTLLPALLALAQEASTLEERSRDVLGWTLESGGSGSVLRLTAAPASPAAWRDAIQQGGSQKASVIVVPAEARIDAQVLQAARAAGISIALSGDPSKSAAAAAALGSPVAVWANPSEWAAASVSPLAALSIVKDRLIGGTLIGGAVSEEFLKEAYRLDLRPLRWSLSEPGLASLRNTVEALVSYHQSYASRTQGTRRLAGVSPEERARIEAALPAQAPARPKKPRKLLVFDLNVGRFGHPSIPHANLAMQLLGQKTGAFQATVSSDPAVLEPESLSRFDAVFLNNTIGDIFATTQARDGFSKFIAGGGGLMANHAVTVTATSWPEFGDILGARGASHRMTDERVRVQIDDPDNPIVRIFDGASFDFSDEIFRFQAPYSRDKVRVLLSIDAARTDMMQGRCYGNCLRDDNDYPIAWIKPHGKGRVFYATLGHGPQVFWDRRILAMFLAAAQYVLGDLPAEDTPRQRSYRALDAALSELSRYGFGQDRAPVRRFEREMALVIASPAETLETEKKLIRLLESDAPLGAKETVCRQLAYMGTEASRPVLEAMLKRRETAEMARYALHGIDSPSPRKPIAAGPRSSPRPATEIRQLHELAMANRRDQLPRVLASLQSPGLDVRIAALQCLPELGGAQQIPLLLERAASTSDPEQAAARFALVRMPSEDVDRALASGLSEFNRAERIEAIRALGERGYPAAAQPLLSALSDPDAAVRREAARALRAIVRPEHAQPLLARMETAPPADWRLYESAVTSAVLRDGKPDASPVIQAFERVTNPQLRQSILTIISQIGSPASLPAVRAALSSSDPGVARAAARALAEWPTAEPLDDLIALARNSADPAAKALALRGFVRLVQLPSDRPPTASVSLLAQALSASSRPEEKRLVLAALQRFHLPESLEAVRKLEADPEVAAEAKNAAAIIQRNLARRPD